MADYVCKNCGNTLAETDRFCGACGTKRVEAQPVENFADQIVGKVASAARNGLGDLFGEKVKQPESVPPVRFEMTKQEIQHLCIAANNLHKAGEFEKEEALLQRAFQRARHDLDYLCTLGRCYRMRERYNEAMQAYQEAIALDDTYAVPHANMASVLIWTGKYQEAEKKCVQALQLYLQNPGRYQPGDYAIWNANYAIAVGKQGRLADALRLLEFAEKKGYANGAGVRKMLGL